MKSVAVVGAGWAGLAAAVRAAEAGHRVTLFEMAPQPGGRAREVLHDGVALDNGQHILIGAYRDTLALMRTVGAEPDRLLDRRPLALIDPHGHGLALPPGTPVPAFARAVLGLRAWSWRERLGLLATALRWRLSGFAAPPTQTVADLARGVSSRARAELIDPLCVAALNTPSEHASARVFLRVLRDALFSGPGAADLLLPKVSLSKLMPDAAMRWLAEHGATLHLGTRVERVESGGRVNGEAFDAVVLSCTAAEAARLAESFSPAWASLAAAFEYEPIITVYLRSEGTQWPMPMIALASDDNRPAQFAFDLGALGGDSDRRGLFAFVVSGARAWVRQGLDVCTQAVLEQAGRDFPEGTWANAPQAVRTLAEKRATFLCTPGLRRPPAHVAPGVAAAGDYVEGPYPATLEGAVRSGSRALQTLGLLPD